MISFSEDLDGLLKENLTSNPLDKLLEKRQNLKEEISLLDNNLGALQKELALDKTNKKEKAQELVLLNKLDKECNRYIKLNDLLSDLQMAVNLETLLKDLPLRLWLILPIANCLN